MSKTIAWFIVGIIVGLIMGSLAGYFYADKSSRGDFGNPNFNGQIDEDQKTEVTVFFESNYNQSEITNYCNANINFCFYYCRQINPDNNLCKNILNLSREGMPQRR